MTKRSSLCGSSEYRATKPRAGSSSARALRSTRPRGTKSRLPPRPRGRAE